MERWEYGALWGSGAPHHRYGVIANRRRSQQELLSTEYGVRSTVKKTHDIRQALSALDCLLIVVAHIAHIRSVAFFVTYKPACSLQKTQSKPTTILRAKQRSWSFPSYLPTYICDSLGLCLIDIPDGRDKRRKTDIGCLHNFPILPPWFFEWLS